MNKVGIICAMDVEFENLRNEIGESEGERICGISFYEGLIGNTNVVLCQCGVGKVNAAMAATILISTFECNLIINSGIAGGIAGVKHEDVVIASKLEYNDVDVVGFGYEYGQVPGMPKSFVPNMETIVRVKGILNKLGIEYVTCPVYSGDIFVSNMDQLKNVKFETPSACEMEGASIAHVCVKSGVDFLVLRFISDVVGEENHDYNYKQFETEMAEKSSMICLNVLKNL